MRRSSRRKSCHMKRKALESNPRVLAIFPGNCEALRRQPAANATWLRQGRCFLRAEASRRSVLLRNDACASRPHTSNQRFKKRSNAYPRCWGASSIAVRARNSCSSATRTPSLGPFGSGAGGGWRRCGVGIGRKWLPPNLASAVCCSDAVVRWVPFLPHHDQAFRFRDIPTTQ